MQYKVQELESIGRCVDCTVLVINTEYELTHFVITPAINNPELSAHLINWANNLKDIAYTDEAEAEIQKYLASKNSHLLTEYDCEELTPEQQAFLDARIAHNQSLLPGQIGLM